MTRGFHGISLTIAGGMAIAVGLTPANPANATLALTPAGIADGFTLTTFATVLPGNGGCCAGPFGVAVNGQGNVVVGLGSTGAWAGAED